MAARNKASQSAQAQGPRGRRQANQRTRKGHAKEKKVKAKAEVKIKVDSAASGRGGWAVMTWGEERGRVMQVWIKAALLFLYGGQQKKRCWIRVDNVLFLGDVSPRLGKSQNAEGFIVFHRTIILT